MSRVIHYKINFILLLHIFHVMTYLPILGNGFPLARKKLFVNSKMATHPRGRSFYKKNQHFETSYFSVSYKMIWWLAKIIEALYIHRYCFKRRFNNSDWRPSGYFLGVLEILHKNFRGVADFAQHSAPSNLYKVHKKPQNSHITLL